MEVVNRSSHQLLAFGWHINYGSTVDVPVPIGGSAEVGGPYVGEMEGESCYIALEGEVVCHDGPNGNKVFHVGPGKPVWFGNQERGVAIRHHADPEDAQSKKLRAISVSRAVNDWLENGE